MLKEKNQQSQVLGHWPIILVTHDAQVDGGVAMLLDGGKQCGAVAVPDLSRMKVIFWVQQLCVANSRKFQWFEKQNPPLMYLVAAFLLV